MSQVELAERAGMTQSRARGLRGADEQHAQVRRVPDAERTIVTGAGELARDLMAHGLVDEVWFTVSPYLWVLSTPTTAHCDQSTGSDNERCSLEIFSI
jgi:dihydrofolate reductase